jgi:hypothetical protein
VAALFASAALTRGWAQDTPTAERPRYELLRYEEDWSALRSRTRADWWDRLKFIPLSRGGVGFLTLGGDLRVRYEAYRNPGFGSDPSDPGGYLLQRYLLHADVHAGHGLRAFAEFASSLESGRAGGPRAYDADALELHQVFAELVLGRRSHSEVVLRAGRQELEFGSSRLVSAHENFNVRQTFDAARILFHDGPWRATAWVARPIRTGPGSFDDGEDTTRVLWGASFTRASRLLLWDNVGVFYLGVHNREGRVAQGTADELRHTVGFRLRRLRRDWDSNLEASLQLGRFGSGRIRAWDVGTHNGVTVPAPLSPRFGLRLDATSGDHDPANPALETFDALFPNTAYSGLAGLIGPANSIDLAPSVRITPGEGITVTSGAAFFWRESSADGLYSVSLSPVRPPGASGAAHVGTQMTLQLEWRMDRHASYTATYTHFTAGRFLTETPPGRNVESLMTWVSYRF